MKKIFYLIMGVFAMGLFMACDNGSTNGQHNNPQNPPATLQDAITWSAERKITTADGNTFTLASAGAQGPITNALTQAWNTTYQNNPNAWTEARWRAIMNDTLVNSGGLSPSELPLTITMKSYEAKFFAQG